MGRRREPRLSAQTLSVLAALIFSSRDEMSGADIARSTQLSSGTVYPILMRLEKAGWIDSDWEIEEPHELSRPRRRLYYITSLGIRKTRQAVSQILLPLAQLSP